MLSQKFRLFIFTFSWLFFAPTENFSQKNPSKNLLASGPMLGYVEMREALLWAQTTRAAAVEFDYWDVEKPAEKYRTERVWTEKSSGFTAKCVADRVLPGHSYEYRLRINRREIALPYPTRFKTQTLWQWRTDPPEFTLATGSCAYINEADFDRPGKPYGSEYQIFTKIFEQKPDLMLWLGDNVYYREPDWATRTGMYHRYSHARSQPELQPLLASTAQYAIWDDHDYGPNDGDGTWIHKEMAWEVFKNFWGNPTFGLPGQKGCTTWFQYNDVDFFLLDNRYFRTPNFCESCPNRSSMGKEQMDWLLASLAASRAPFKIVAVGGQVLTTSDNDETLAHFFPADRDTMLRHIEREKIKGVVFLTGDRHYTELSETTNSNGDKVWDLTCSALTSGSYTNPEKREKNIYRVAGTVVDVHNFALLKFSGPRKERQLEIKVIDVEGKERWTRILK